ncbi:hypothetical protein [Microbacterium sp. KR10-403]|uniref:hypothetical protein n=1 Tax=Microbacterium sp. KR10-403 TaxID=3158581 RepID=UPI0032E4E1F2
MLSETPDEARKAAYDADWVTDVDGKDYCARHRDDAASPYEGAPAESVPLPGMEVPTESP